MIILSCNNISLSYGTSRILDGVSFNIQSGDKTGFVGVNGAGKSTLLKIICGRLKADDGEIYISKDYKLGYLDQHSGLESSNTILNEILSVFSNLIVMEKKLKVLEESISSEKDEQRLNSLMNEYSRLSETFSRSGGYEYNSRARGVLKGLGFTEDRYETRIRTLSGGQKTRLALARLLLEEPDLLLLDEPTNHLDIGAIEWLEDFLKNYKKSVVLVSHDRYFLDMITNRTLELENCKAKLYNGNYSAYVRLKEQDREIQQKQYDLQQKEIARLEAFIEQQKRWNRERNIIAAESRQKAIDRMQKTEGPGNLPGKIKIKFRSSIISGNDVLFVENLSKEYSGKSIFRDVSFMLRKEENAFLLGPNGCGKSTLLKILSGKIPQSSGNFEYGHNVSMGYFDQETDELDNSKTIIEEVWGSNEKLTMTEIRNALASFLFTGEDVFKQISVLSGGEKSRVAIIKLMLSNYNFLILDEPTNHLDINSREVLEQALANFDGTLLIVSHDRYFINKLATRIFEFNERQLIDCKGDYTFYNNYKARLKIAEQITGTKEKTATAAKIEFTANKEEKARQRKLERQLSHAEFEIEATERRLSEIENQMHDENTASDHVRLNELLNEQLDLRTKLEELYKLWHSLME